MKIEIDGNSGFCFGVVYAIERAEAELKNNEPLYCLGDIVHNGKEVERLTKKGLVTIDHQQFSQLKNTKVLIRAHGEPPETYRIALENNIELLDASCPVVLKLQTNIVSKMEKVRQANGQMIIFGTKDHAEVNGLVGQTTGKAIVISSEDEIDKIDFTKPVTVFSQTTKSLYKYRKLTESIRERIIAATGTDDNLDFNDSICRQVANRNDALQIFAKKFDVVVFVSGKKSSNGKALYEVCKKENDKTYFVSGTEEIEKQRFINCNSVGICGATSTPKWLMEEVALAIKEL